MVAPFYMREMCAASAFDALHIGFAKGVFVKMELYAMIGIW